METKPKLVVLDTMNFGWIVLYRLLEVIKRVDVITINDEEARQLSGEYSLVKLLTP
jgi:sugar/nucleoside kinase (ribokinase family)